LYCRAKLDSHANTCGVKNVAIVKEFHGNGEVSGFANSMEPLGENLIVKPAIAYDCPMTVEIVVLIINEAMYFGEHLSYAVIYPNQIRAYDVIVDNIPKHLQLNSTYSIIVKEGYMSVPLHLQVVKSHFHARTPMFYEIENVQQITLASEEECNP
jgi:hypothetical protein